MPSDDIVDRLASHRLLATVPRQELEWLAAHGYLRSMQRGGDLARDPEFVDKIVIPLTGHILINVDRGLGPRRVMQWGGGDVTGVLPYPRMSGPYIGDVFADEPGDFFLVSRSYFPEM